MKFKKIFFIICIITSLSSERNAYAQNDTTFKFIYTGSPRKWTVPGCIYSITIECYGAQGGGTNGGMGSYATGQLNVVPGQILTINVGGQGLGAGFGGSGGPDVPNTNGILYYGGHGGIGYPGGGKSDVLIGATELIAAGGGGGEGGGGGGGDGSPGSGIGGAPGGGTAPDNGNSWGLGGNGGNGGTGNGGNGTNGSPGGGGSLCNATPYGFGAIGATGGASGGASCYCSNPTPGASGIASNGGNGGLGGNYGCGGYQSPGSGGGGGGAGGGYPTNGLGGGGGGGGTQPANWYGSPGGGGGAGGTVGSSYTGGMSSLTNIILNSDTGNGLVNITCKHSLILVISGQKSPTCGNCNGSATVTPIGTSPYTYFWSPGGQSTQTANGLCAGTDTISVTDITGCTATAIVTITQPPAITGTQTVSNIICYGGVGSATVSISGGVTPYTYLWNPSGETTASATGLSANTYTVTITDSLGCTATILVAVTEPNPVTVTINANILCHGGTGSADAVIGGGTSPYTYLWNPSGQTNATATGLSVGIYTVSVKDSNGCSTSANVTLTQPTVLTATMGLINNIPCRGGTSNATVTAAGGTFPYIYIWNPSGRINATGTALTAGTYTVDVIDKNHCTASAIATITQPSAVLSATVTVTTNITCHNGSNGIATVTAGGGTGPYTYLWMPGNITNASATGLSAQTYTITVTDIHGCTATANTTLTQPVAMVVTISEPKTICKDSTGTILANITGGTPPYTYAWSAGVTSTTGTATITPVAIKDYSVVVTDINGCTASANIVLQYGPPLFVTITGNSFICLGDSVTLCASASGGVGGNSYLWAPDSNTNACISVSPNSSSIYTVSVVDGCGATTTASTTIYLYPPPLINMTADVYQGCAPLCVQFQNGTSLSQGVIKQYLWSFGNGDSAQSTNPDYCYTGSGKYTVSLTVITDKGCHSTLSETNMITVYKGPDAAFTYSSQPGTGQTPGIQFTDESTDAYSIVYWMWGFGDGTGSTSNLQNPFYNYPDIGNYCVNLVVVDSHGCRDTATNCLLADPNYTLYIPSSFTPNGDGLNDFFQPKGQYIKSFEMYIFDRWGMELYHTIDISKGWNGTVHGGTTISQEDIYVYKIMVTDLHDNQHSYIGKITLIK